MKIALYNENPGELEALSGQLEQCARECLRFMEITPYRKQEDFCNMIRSGPDYDLFVVAQDGTFSLEVVELLREMRPQACIFWLSNLDFALRAYRYNADWFGQKPVATPAQQNAFKRLLFINRGGNP